MFSVTFDGTGRTSVVDGHVLSVLVGRLVRNLSARSSGQSGRRHWFTGGFDHSGTSDQTCSDHSSAQSRDRLAQRSDYRLGNSNVSRTSHGNRCCLHHSNGRSSNGNSSLSWNNLGELERCGWGNSDLLQHFLVLASSDNAVHLFLDWKDLLSNLTERLDNFAHFLNDWFDNFVQNSVGFLFGSGLLNFTWWAWNMHLVYVDRTGLRSELNGDRQQIGLNDQHLGLNDIGRGWNVNDLVSALSDDG